MKQKNIKNNNKYNNSFNQNIYNNKTFKTDSQYNNCIVQCNKYKEMANQKWQQAECDMNRASKIAREAQCCLQRAAQCYRDCYKDDFGCNLGDFGYDEDDEYCDCYDECGCNHHNQYGCNQNNEC